MKQPWMPLYVGDYIRDTRALSTQGHGAYLLLIMEYWTHGALPNDDESLARICLLSDKDWLKLKPSVARFFDMPSWRHKRIEEELEKARAAYERRASAGQRGGIAKAEAKPPSSNARRSLHPEAGNA